MMPMKTDYQHNYELLQGVISTVSDNLYSSAAKSGETYADAVKYLKQMDQQTYGTMNDSLDFQTRQFLSLVIGRVIQQIHHDANSQKVNQ